MNIPPYPHTLCIDLVFFDRHKRAGIIHEIKRIIQDDKKISEWVEEKYQALEAQAKSGGKARNGKNSGK